MVTLTDLKQEKFCKLLVSDVFAIEPDLKSSTWKPNPITIGKKIQHPLVIPIVFYTPPQSASKCCKCVNPSEKKGAQ